MDTIWHQARRIARFDLGLDTWHPCWPKELPFSAGDLLAEEVDPVLLADQLRRFSKANATPG